MVFELQVKRRYQLNVEVVTMKLARYLVILAVAFLLASPATAAVVAQNDQEVQTIANPILDTVLTGFNNGNYALYSKYFDTTMKNAMPEKKFRQVRRDFLKKLGKYQSRSYKGFEQTGNFTVALWKGRFSASDDDVTIKLVLIKPGKKVEVAGLWFQ
jgi:opacity protein-like surface antigen